jgi:magnesium chelatase family protein
VTDQHRFDTSSSHRHDIAVTRRARVSDVVLFAHRYGDLVLIGHTSIRSVAAMLARVATFCLDGLDSRPVTVEVDIRPGLPAFAIVGLGDAAVRESRERVRVALLNSGFEFPLRRIVANLAPAHLRKNGSGFDLAIACGVLAASGQVPAEPLARCAVFGELSLTGALRPCRGSLAVAEAARRAGLATLLLPRERAREAALVEGIEVVGADTLAEVADVLAGGTRPPLPAVPIASGAARAHGDHGPDLADVGGHETAIKVLGIAAAGGHNVLLRGSPGTGKTMLARRLPTILPPMTRGEAIEVTRIQSIAGIHRGGALADERPFRAPHHTISASGLVGGGPWPAPGEASLAHNGVLFLDELSEYSRPALQALRQPLEDGRVAIVRGQRTVVFPTRFSLVAATNPCPCGFADEPRRCRCSEADHARHARRLSGPLLDRIDLVAAIQRPTAAELAGPPITDSATLRADVIAARERQTARLAETAAVCNAHMDAGLVRRLVRLDAAGARALDDAYARRHISARGRDRVLKVARTIADLAARDRVTKIDVLEALTLRGQEDPVAEAAA